MIGLSRKNQDASAATQDAGLPDGMGLVKNHGLNKKVGPKQSKFVVVLYVITGILTAYGGYMIYYTIGYIKDYYTSYGTSVSDDLANVIQYVITNSALYFVYALLLFTGARILKRVLDMKNNPAVSES